MDQGYVGAASGVAWWGYQAVQPRHGGQQRSPDDYTALIWPGSTPFANQTSHTAPFSPKTEDTPGRRQQLL